MNRTEPASYQEFDSLLARVAGVIRSPRALFRALVDRPNWVGTMAASFAVSALCGAGLMQTPVGRQALVDQWERTALAFGQEVTDERYAELVALSAHATEYALGTALLGGPVLTVGAATLIYLAFGRRRGETATFRQVLAMVTHAGVILVVRQAIAAPLNFSRESLASPTTLGLFFPMLDEASPAARFLGGIDLFVVWWTVVLAIGVAVLYRRPARRTAVAFMGAYVAFAALLVAAMAVSGGTV